MNESQPPHIALDLATQRLASVPEHFVELFQKMDVSVEIYAPVAVDEQKPHDRDEFYFIASGQGIFRLENTTISFSTGDFLFVPAHAEHRFEQFSDDFKTWVVFFGAAKPAP